MTGGAAQTLDLAQLNEVTSGDASFERELLTDFVDSTRQDETDLRAAVARGDHAAARRCAHRIQGASCVIGAMELVDACAAIQSSAMAGSSTETEIPLPAFDRALERVYACIQSRLAGTQAAA